MLTNLGKGLLARLLAYGVFALGFWVLYRALLSESIPMGILGGGLILLGTYLIVNARRISNFTPQTPTLDDKEEPPGDSLPGSR